MAYGAPNDSSPIGRFDITGFDVQGNTLLPAQDIKPLLDKFIGTEKDFSTIQQAVETLENAYRQKGYDLVRVVLPEQELNHGVVILKVVESKIGKITVKGNQFFSSTNIKDSLPSIKEGETPVMSKISANLKVANDDPAKKTTVQLLSGEQSGLVDAILQVNDEKPWSAAVGIDNTGDEVTGRNRLTVMYQNANVGGWDNVLSMQYTTSFANPNDVQVYGIGYHIPLYALNDSLDFFSSYSNVNSGTVTAGVFDVAVSGSGTVFGARYNHNILKVGDYNSVLTFGADYKEFNNDETLSGLPLGGDITVHPVSVSYTGDWSVSGTSLNFYVTAVHNITGGADDSPADFEKARSGASPNYNLLRFGGTFQHTTQHDLEFKVALNGQLTSDALIQGEEFGAGGANSVRGFSEREVVEDKGAVANLELYSSNLCTDGALCKVLGFYDAAHLMRNDALPDELQSISISSVGVGFRYTRAPAWLLQTDFAHVIDGTSTSDRGSNRIHFRVVYTF